MVEVSQRVGLRKSYQLWMGVVGIALFSASCGADGTGPLDDGFVGELVPSSLDGLWILQGTDLNLDIDIETAQVDGRTSCSRLLGSLTFLDGGATTSFSLPGREDRGCSDQQEGVVDDIQQLLESVASVEAEEGGYRLLNDRATLLGRLRIGS